MDSKIHLFRKFKRWIKHRWQILIRGWSDDETWNLDLSLAKLIYPRLVRFKELNNAFHPDYTEETWDEALDLMIESMRFHCSGDRWDYDNSMSNEDWENIKKGDELFGKHFQDLWW
jgi:hypothetical protein